MFVAGHPGSTDRQLTVAELRDPARPDPAARACCARPSSAAATSSSARRTPRPTGSCRTRCSASRTASRCSASSSTRCSTTRCWPRSTTRSRTCASARAATARSQPRSATRGRASRQRKPRKPTRWLPYEFLEGGAGFNSRLARYARTLVRAAAERPKPNAERLREYTDGFLPRLEQQLAAPLPIYPELERLTLSFSLERMREWLGPRRAGRAPPARDRNARRARRTARRRLAARGPGRPHAAVERRPGRDRCLERSVDRARARARRGSARAAQMARGRDRSRRRGGARGHRARALRGPRHERLSRRHVHAAAELRHRARLGRERHARRAVHAARPACSSAPRANRRSPFPRAGERRVPTLDLATPFNLSTNNDIVGGNSGSPLDRRRRPHRRPRSSTATSTRSRARTGSTRRRTARSPCTPRSFARR